MPLRRRIGALTALAAALLASQARGDDPTKRGFDVGFSRPALSLEGGLFVETAQRAASGQPLVGVRLDYAKGLLALEMGNQRDQLIESRLSAHLFGAYAHGPWEFAVELPLVLSQTSDFSLLTDQGVTGPMVAPVASSALGDLRLATKLALLRETAPIGLAALLDLRLPTGDKSAFASDGLALQPGLVATHTFGRLRVDAQVGYLFRQPGQYAQLVVDDGLTYGLGTSLPLANPEGTGLASRTRAMAELVGGWPRGNDASTERYRAPLSVRGGLRTALGRGFSVEAGAGTGIGEAGYGRESWRVFGGIRWSPRPAERPPQAASTPATARPGDRDGDGVPDDKDQCPDQPGPAELDGCPDRDGDFIPDWQDKCPDVPGLAEYDGCPAPPGPVVEIETEKLSLRDAIHFDTAKATIKHQSDHVLDAIATLLKDHPELKRIRVEGHTDNVGAAAYNKDLSQRRADSVVRALIQRGVAAGRLTAAGYGLERPIADNRTALGRAKNRRVEFTILDEKAM